MPDLERACDRLTYLHISHNQISHIPVGYFSNCQALTTLYMHNNLLTSLSPFSEIGGSITFLYLRSNKINSVNETDLKNLHGLKTLDLGYNQMTSFNVKAFLNTPSLVSLNLMVNQLTTFESPYKWCMDITCQDLHIVLNGNPVICGPNWCWAKRYPSLITIAIDNCLGNSWENTTLDHLACGGKVFNYYLITQAYYQSFSLILIK